MEEKRENEEKRVGGRRGSGGEPKFGWLGFEPKALQRLNTAGCYLLFMSTANFFQSMVVNGLTGVALSSIERRFGLRSGQSSWIVSAYDAATVPMLALVSVLGPKNHRPRWVAVTLFALAVGAVLFALPHFATPVFRPADGPSGGSVYCAADDERACDQVQVALSHHLWLFIFARILFGVGATPLYTTAVTFLDDNCDTQTFSLYVAVFFACGVLGPAVGYVAGGFMLTLFTDFPSSAPDGLAPADRRWVGCWWFLFLVAGGCIALVAVPLAGYPADLPDGASIRAKKRNEAHHVTRSPGPTASFPSLALALLRNPTYVALTLYICCDSFLIAGFTAFGPKYLENQFATTAAVAGVFFGAITVPAGAGGTVLGGVVIKRFALRCRDILRVEAILSVAVWAAAGMFFVGCPALSFAGVTVPYPLDDDGTGGLGGITSGCNSNCSCAVAGFEPVCTEQNLYFFSPCHAGCANDSSAGDATVFVDCRCVNATVSASTSTSTSMPTAVSSHFCRSEHCDWLYVFGALFFVGMFGIFVANGMNVSATIRSVRPDQRPLAVGAQWIALRCFGALPGPIAFGGAFDRSCILSDESSCSSSSACILYDSGSLSAYMFAISCVVKLVALVSILFACRVYKPPPTEHSPTEHSPTEHSPTEHSPTEHSPTEHSPTEHSPTERAVEDATSGKEANSTPPESVTNPQCLTPEVLSDWIAGETCATRL